jgi:hypothetical protein
MNKTLILCLSALLISPAYAEESPTAEVSPYGLRANLKKAALEFSSTEVKNAEQYEDSPNSRLSGDSETVTKGLFDFVLEYEQPKYQWNNSLFMEYGKTKLKPIDGPDVTSENSDKILLTSDYARKVWQYWDADVGPFGSLGYQTEFSPNDDAPRTKTLRAKAGIKLFNGKYIKELYAAAVGEEDFTYSTTTAKSAYEIGLKAEYQLREGVKFELESMFRDYLTYSSYEATDFTYELDTTARMMVDLSNNLALGPYIQYLQAKDRGSANYGSSTIIGVTLSFGNLWNL